MSTTSFNSSTSSTTIFFGTTTASATTGSISNHTLTNHTTNSTNHTTTNHTTTKHTTTTYPPETWFFVLNPIFIVLLMLTSIWSGYSIYKYYKKLKSAETMKGERSSIRMKMSVMICLFIYGFLRNIALGMQIQMGISTKGMTQMFDCVRVVGFFPWYAVLLVVLHKWIITCIKLKLIMHGFPKLPVTIGFVIMHLFVYFALATGLAKDIVYDWDYTWNQFYDWLVVVIFGVLFISFGVTGSVMIYRLWTMKRGKSNFNLHTATTSAKFIKKLALALAVFLVFLLWRMIDFAVYKFAKNAKGQWVYTTTQQVELYPLESTFPECFPIFFLLFMYKARLPWEKKKKTKLSGEKSSSSLGDSGKMETSTTSLGSSTSAFTSGSAKDEDTEPGVTVSVELDTRA